jgi:hypothetical protein
MMDIETEVISNTHRDQVIRVDMTTLWSTAGVQSPVSNTAVLLPPKERKPILRSHSNRSLRKLNQLQRTYITVDHKMESGSQSNVVMELRANLLIGGIPIQRGERTAVVEETVKNMVAAVDVIVTRRLTGLMMTTEMKNGDNVDIITGTEADVEVPHLMMTTVMTAPQTTEGVIEADAAAVMMGHIVNVVRVIIHQIQIQQAATQFSGCNRLGITR